MNVPAEGCLYCAREMTSMKVTITPRRSAKSKGISRSHGLRRKLRVPRWKTLGALLKGFANGPIVTWPMDHYADIVRQMKQRHELRIKRWRRTMSGCAWRVYHADGRSVNWVESPRPRTPISLAIFLHEVGHHVIGFEKYKKRCEEEYHAWVWAIREMRKMGVQPDARVLRRFDLSMRYAVDKAVRRGIKKLPEMLEQFAEEKKAA